MARFLRLISAILAFFIYTPAGEIAPYAPLKKEGLQLGFTVLSDVHMESNNSERFKMFGEGLRDMASAEEKSRALVFLGDNTMNGQATETSFFYGLLQNHNVIDNVLMAAGNHDICPGDRNTGDYEKLKNRFIDYNNAFLDHKIDQLYHSQVIDGYHFIVLASDRDEGVQQYLSPAQLSWLDGELKSAAESGKPVFLFSHWPPDGVFSDVWAEGHVGAQSDELHTLLTKYDNRIFYFTGHLHMGIYENGYGVKEDGKITYINVPSFGSENTNGDADVQNTGMGLQVEVYETQAVVRVRNFAAHTPTDYEYRFAL